MTADATKGHLRAVLATFTAGTLHLLAEIIRADARKAGDDLAVERGVSVEATLFVVGLGIDALHVDQEPIMPNKRSVNPPTSEGPTALGVSDMAARCQLSRSRFHALVRAGVFPEPLRQAGRRPYYPTDLIERCLEVRRTGVGANGQVVMFNRRLGRKPSR